RLLDWLRRWGGGRRCSEVKSERRLWVRFPCQFQANCVPARGATGERCSVQVLDISRGGFRMLVKQPVTPGDFLSIEVPAQTTIALLAYVVRVTPRNGGEWEVG